ncbi:MAG: sigma-54 dependent transcriptional regulator [Acidobacteriota bacterium]
MSSTVLLVDDDALFGLATSDLLAADGFDVRHAKSLAEARTLLPGAGVVILDHRLPDGVGFDLIPEIRRQRWQPKILLVTASPELENAVEALRLGIEDYFTKPIDTSQLRLAVHRCLRTLSLEREIELDRRRRRDERAGSRLVGSLAEGPLRDLVDRAAGVRSPVLITGETGTGKSLLAKTVHYTGRPESPFVSLNCGAVPETLLEAELFGVEKGAFTGATRSKPGLLELADGGTLFLDEIGELPTPLQSKLLGVLDDESARRLGGVETRRFDARIIAATNVELEAAIAEGRFREDLFYRLNVVRLHVPPLRHREGDVEVLSTVLLEQVAGMPVELAPGELEVLRAYRWPGNVRELRNVLERSWLLDGPGPLRPSRLLASAPGSGVSTEASADRRREPTERLIGGRGVNESQPREPAEIEPLAVVEQRHLEAAVAACATQREAAERLGIGVATLRRKMASYRRTRREADSSA